MTAGDGLLVITNATERVFQRSILRGAREIGAARGLRVEVLEVPRRTAASRALVAPGRPPAGVLLVADVLPDEAVQELVGRGVTLTLVSHRIEGLDVPSIMHDNEHGIALLAAHLLDERGCRRPVFLRGSPRQLDARQREEAFRRECMRRSPGLSEPVFLDGDFEPATAASSLQRFLEEGGTLDGLLGADYLMAIAAKERLESHGVRVPDDVAIAGFGDGVEAARAGVTTVAADVVELGRRAARQLVGQIDGLEVRGLTLLSTTLLPRASTATPITAPEKAVSPGPVPPS